MDTRNFCGIISLTGPKHSGKTTLGRKLARLLGADFLDLDLFIEERTGKSPRILYREGAEVFRKAELEALQEALERNGQKQAITVLAAGGGIIDNPEAAALLKQKTLVVYLEVSPGKAWQRILKTSQTSGELPPFLQTGDPEKTHRELHQRRSIGYREISSYTVNTETSNIKKIVRQIRDYIGNL